MLALAEVQPSVVMRHIKFNEPSYSTQRGRHGLVYDFKHLFAPKIPESEITKLKKTFLMG